ncbi:MAG: DNA-directed RNA polymerase subunit D [Methanobrevibacter sp.]
MEIEVKDQNDDEIVFIIRDAEVPFVNAIRRTAMMSIPKLAIEDVNIVKNDSAMFDEVLAHRLGLTPLVSDLESIEGLVLPDECDCDDYCPHCSVSFTLNKKGPGVVYSKDLVSSDPKIKPVYDTIPLVKLKENEEIELEAVAKLGFGKEHAKWMPTTVCAYKQYPKITFDETMDVDYDCASACPRGILKADRRSKIIKVLDIENCAMCKSCERASVKDNEGNTYIHVGHEENDFIFKIETDGSMPPKEVLLKACDVLENKADQLIEFSKGGK